MCKIARSSAANVSRTRKTGTSWVSSLPSSTKIFHVGVGESVLNVLLMPRKRVWCSSDGSHTRVSNWSLRQACVASSSDWTTRSRRLRLNRNWRLRSKQDPGSCWCVCILYHLLQEHQFLMNIVSSICEYQLRTSLKDSWHLRYFISRNHGGTGKFTSWLRFSFGEGNCVDKCKRGKDFSFYSSN